MDEKKKILLTGATGYVGGKLLKRLELDGHDINCLVRDSSKLGSVGVKTEVYNGDVLVRSSMRDAMQGVDTAYYLIHSMLVGPRRFEDADTLAAHNFRTAAEEQAIYAAAKATTVKSDAIDGDDVSYTIGNTTVDAGNQNVANQQLNIAGNTVWALILTARVQ